VLTLVLSVLVWFLVRDRPAELGLPSPVPQTGGGGRSISLTEAVRRVLASPHFWPVAVWFFFDCGVFFSFGGLWGGPYLMQVYGLNKSEAGRILSMIAVGMVVGSPFLSYLSSNVFKARKPVIVLSSVVVLGLTALLAFFTAGLSVPALYLICLGLGIFASAVVVVGFTTNKELFPVQMAGTATGLVNLFPFAGGAVFQPVLGWILERAGREGSSFTLAGYQSAFLVLFGCALVALTASLLLKETMSR
jgi:sugar phosphate permease